MMSVMTSGEIVSSIEEISIGLPVVACWNRWFRPDSGFAKKQILNQVQDDEVERLG
jgi:hypothetical protein